MAERLRADMKAPAAAVNLREVACARCGGRVERIARRGVDRLISLIVPLRRYRCCAHGCAWEGTLRAPPGASSRYSTDRRRPYL